MDLGLSGKVVMITGASRGLGRAMAAGFAAEGAKLSICARGAEALERAAAELKNTGAEVLAQTADTTDSVHMERWVAATLERLGGIDVLVNNAGTARVGALHELDDAAWRESFEQNFFSAVRLSRMAAAQMEKRGDGAIVNISSIYGREAGGPITYNASKAALIALTKMLARELAPKHIRVNAIAPGSIIYPGGVWQEIFTANPAFEKDFLSHDFPFGRLGRPDEVASAVVFLASPRASWIAGACLPVDGAQGRSNI
jgi:3-oxoacyl-[acyl-carrier protein] reductase